MKEQVKPTESELEILSILWQKGSATVRDVHAELSKTKDSGYTTTLKLMQIMDEKGLVSRNTDQKSHIYRASSPKQRTQSKLVNNLIANAFAGSSADLVLEALGGNRTTEEELEKIEAFIATLKSKK